MQQELESRKQRKIPAGEISERPCL